MRCALALTALSEKELLAAISFLGSGDELSLAIPIFSVASFADESMEPESAG